ncbi:hypothetical protein CKO28_26810 [Rhodovibrio sodomensis]|uniref:ATP-dependent endonuclease n=2 Tax=Rhodovibrio sodomensis TaxID=1088 RepID=A0ABS1DM95_9PROT|nr:hypothetical protein [Rhodovibrio sodomensis]
MPMGRRGRLPYNGWIDAPREEWLKSENVGHYASRQKISETPLVDYVAPSGRLSKSDIEQAQQKYIEEHIEKVNFVRQIENGPLLGQKNVGGGVLPEFFLVPAVRDLTEEIKIKSNTTFGRLMNRAVNEMAERDERFIEAKQRMAEVIQSLNDREQTTGRENELKALESRLEDELKTWGVSVNIQISPPEMEKIFELGTDVHLDDGVQTTADRKGHGLQRAMMFALIRSWAAALKAVPAGSDQEQVKARKQSESVIFAIEEPELYLHPHAQRRLAKSLRDISDTDEHQVLLGTHSTHFVDLNFYRDIGIISKPSPAEGSQIRQCTEELFESGDVDDRKRRFHMAQWINPERGEIFFAEKVVFVEGETEKVMIPFVAEKLGLFNPEVSVIDCGAKHNLPLYIKIANAFGIPYVVVHDEDPLPEVWGADVSAEKRRERERTYALNDTIATEIDNRIGSQWVFASDFEAACGVSKTAGKKKGKALAALEHFSAVSEAEVPDTFAELVRAIYE